MTTPPPPPPQEPYSGMPSGDGNLRPETDDDKTMGMITHGLGLVLGFLGPLIIMLAKKESPFLQQEAKEALNFQIVITAASVISWVLIFVFIGCILLPIVVIVDVIFVIMAIMKVNEGSGYRYPINIRLIK